MKKFQVTLNRIWWFADYEKNDPDFPETMVFIVPARSEQHAKSVAVAWAEERVGTIISTVRGGFTVKQVITEQDIDDLTLSDDLEGML